VPTLIICGDQDPYLNYDLVYAAPERLPEGSALEVIKGASHVAFIEKPYHQDFQERLSRFLSMDNEGATGKTPMIPQKRGRSWSLPLNRLALKS
jgi:predicted alpha/beta-fold hydrolase